jgi:hypothetical protein
VCVCVCVYVLYSGGREHVLPVALITSAQVVSASSPEHHVPIYSPWWRLPTVTTLQTYLPLPWKSLFVSFRLDDATFLASQEHHFHTFVIA